MIYDCIIVGGGIVGMATAQSLIAEQPGSKILLIEKEELLAQHQTGRNSGVIHSGIYYKPGSFKARFAKAGAQSMVEFCREHGLKHNVCGKVIVACDHRELPLLENLYQRGLQNGLAIQKMKAEEVREIEPNVQCLAGLRVPTTGIVSYRQVCQKYMQLFEAGGGEIRMGLRVLGSVRTSFGHVVETTEGSFETRFLVNCAGLHSDRVARMEGTDPRMKIVPFRGSTTNWSPKSGTS